MRQRLQHGWRLPRRLGLRQWPGSNHRCMWWGRLRDLWELRHYLSCQKICERLHGNGKESRCDYSRGWKDCEGESTVEGAESKSWRVERGGMGDGDELCIRDVSSLFVVGRPATQIYTYDIQLQPFLNVPLPYLSEISKASLF